MVRRADQGAWPAALRAHGFAGDGGAKKRSQIASSRSSGGQRARRRADQRQAYESVGKRRGYRRPESCRAQRLVCRATFGHRRSMQDLRGKSAIGRTLENDSRRSLADRAVGVCIQCAVTLRQSCKTRIQLDRGWKAPIFYTRLTV